jgi:hypothetical protein
MLTTTPVELDALAAGAEAAGWDAAGDDAGGVATGATVATGGADVAAVDEQAAANNAITARPAKPRTRGLIEGVYIGEISNV